MVLSWDMQAASMAARRFAAGEPYHVIAYTHQR